MQTDKNTQDKKQILGRAETKPSLELKQKNKKQVLKQRKIFIVRAVRCSAMLH